MDENKLRTCPFCGGKARVIVHHNDELSWIRYSVECYRCCAETDKYWMATDAEEAWNRRVGEGGEGVSGRFPKDCWGKDCPHFHVWDMSVDDLCCACDLLKRQCDACDEDYSLLRCPKEEPI